MNSPYADVSGLELYLRISCVDGKATWRDWKYRSCRRLPLLPSICESYTAVLFCFVVEGFVSRESDKDNASCLRHKLFREVGTTADCFLEDIWLTFLFQFAFSRLFSHFLWGPYRFMPRECWVSVFSENLQASRNMSAKHISQRLWHNSTNFFIRHFLVDQHPWICIT